MIKCIVRSRCVTSCIGAQKIASNRCFHVDLCDPKGSSSWMGCIMRVAHQCFSVFNGICIGCIVPPTSCSFAHCGAKIRPHPHYPSRRARTRLPLFSARANWGSLTPPHCRFRMQCRAPCRILYAGFKFSPKEPIVLVQMLRVEQGSLSPVHTQDSYLAKIGA